MALSKVAEGDLVFDYWIVGIEDAQVLETEIVPSAIPDTVESSVVPVVSVDPIAPETPSVAPVESAPAVEETPVVPADSVATEASPAPEAVAPAAAPVEVAPVSNEIINP